MKQLEDIKFAISYHALMILIAAYDWISSIGKLTELTHQYQYLPFLSDISLATVYIKDVKRGAEHEDRQILVSDRTDRRTNGWTDRLTDAINILWAFLVLKNLVRNSFSLLYWMKIEHVSL